MVLHSFVLNTVYVMFVCFTVHNAKHNPSNNYEIYHRKWRFSIVMGFPNASENEFYSFGNLVI